MSISQEKQVRTSLWCIGALMVIAGFASMEDKLSWMSACLIGFGLMIVGYGCDPEFVLGKVSESDMGKRYKTLFTFCGALVLLIGFVLNPG